MKLTIITDHRFYRKDSDVFDDYVFNYNFFKTYLKVFDEIDVVARVKKVEVINQKWTISTGNHVNFIDIPDLHGFKWLFMSYIHFYNNRKLILDTDCFCFRVPSHASWCVYKLNKGTKHYMFECIGDPRDSMVSSSHAGFKSKFYSLLGSLLANRMSKVVKYASVGSYVSLNHLQKKYPFSGLSESISSIRLNENYILPQGKTFHIEKIRIIHVGSFIPLKNQKDLINCVAKLADKFDVHLDLIGDGVLREKCEALVCDLGIENKVTFYGQLTGFEKVIEVLDRNTFFILPSSNEGMPRALIEAMARGLICFGSDVGGIKELLDSEFLFQPGDINAMFTLLNNFIINNNLESYNSISLANSNKANQFEFSVLEEKRINILNMLKSKINERVEKSV